MAIKCNLPVHPFDPEKLIGFVSQVTPASVKIKLLDSSNPAFKSAAKAKVGEFLFIDCDEYALFSQFTDLYLPESEKHALETSTGEPPKLNPIGTADLLTSAEINTGSIYPGIVATPGIGAKVYLADPKLIQLIAENRRSLSEDKDAVLLTVANLPDSHDTPVSLTPERIFGCHCAVLGTTGAGKSWTVARLVEESSHKPNSKIILFDATGEYFRLNKGVRHIYVGNDPDPRKGEDQVVVPYYHLSEMDLFAIFKPRGQSQGPKLRAAMKTLKVARLAPQIAPGGTIIKAHKSKLEFEKQYYTHVAEVENPFADFEIKNLIAQLQNECIDPQRSQSEPKVWGGPNNNDLSYCVPLINRIQDILQSPNLESIFNPGKKESLFKAIHGFLQDDSLRVLRISLEHLSFDYNCREIIANAVGRHLLTIARRNYYQDQPLVVVVDEAHQFLDKALGTDEGHEYPLDSFALIAKEGRKYSISICLATQRPRDIPEGVLSQMGTLIVHRLINHNDRHVIERACGELDRSSANTIPTLSPGEAIIVGVSFPVPLTLKIKAPNSKPQSSSADYQKYWS